MKFITRRLQGMSWKKVIMALGLAIILTACSGDSVENKMHTHLEEAVELEQDFETLQVEITELEKQEQEIYERIIELGMEELEEIKELSQDAIAIIEERSEKIDLERESMMSAKDEFLLIEALLEEMEDESARQKGEDMYQTMMERYDAYDELYDAYKESLDLEIELYTMLQEEGLEQDELNEHIEK